MKKRMIVIPFVVAVSIVGIVFGCRFLVIRIKSSKHNLIILKECDLPEKLELVEDNFIQLSEVNMHYVKYGNAPQSVILVHGNRSSGKALEELASYLANDYSVYCLDSRDHGLSSETNALSYDFMANDVHEFIVAKELKNPYFVGHSDGGIIGLILSKNHPDELKACIACGANSNPNGLTRKYLRNCKRNKDNKYYKLMLDEPNLTKEFLGTITTPTYIVAGEYDVIRLSDTVFLHESIPNSKIAIVKNNGHSTYISKNGKLAYYLVNDYFKELESK